MWEAVHNDQPVPLKKNGKSDMRRVKPAAKRVM